jgi:hypothetical protein
MDCRDILERAAALAALREDDPERVAARAHAEHCPSCAQVLQEASRLQELLVLPAAAVDPAPAGLAHLETSIVAELASEQTRARRSVALASVAAFALVVARSALRPHPVSVWLGAGLLAVIAVAASVTTLRAPRLVAALTVLVSLIAAVLAGGSGPLAPGLGVHCVLSELAAGSVPFAILLSSFLRGRAPGGTLRLAALAGGGALAGQAALHVACPEAASLDHLLAFHVGAIPLAVVLAAGMARGASRWAAWRLR